MSLRGGTTKQPRRVQYAHDEVATLSLAMTHGIDNITSPFPLPVF